MALWDAGDDKDEVIDPPVLGHVVVLAGDVVNDVYGTLGVQKFFDKIESWWGYCPDELLPITEGEVFKVLKRTSEARIAQLMNEMA